VLALMLLQALRASSSPWRGLPASIHAGIGNGNGSGSRSGRTSSRSTSPASMVRRRTTLWECSSWRGRRRARERDSDGCCFPIHRDSPEPLASQVDRWPDTDDSAWPEAAQLPLEAATGSPFRREITPAKIPRGPGAVQSDSILLVPFLVQQSPPESHPCPRQRPCPGRDPATSAKRARRRVSDHREVPCGAVARRTQRSGRPRAFPPAGRGLVRRA
jgi:hypothetical protein